MARATRRVAADGPDTTSPRADTSQALHPPTPSHEYQSKFDEWDKKAWVRSKPHHSVIEPFEPDLDFFSRSLCPLFLTRSVQEAPPEVQRPLLTLHLYDWLEFTEWLELGPVNNACDLVRQSAVLPWLPLQMKADALKIYTDEAGHAEMSHALVRAIEDYTGVPSARTRPAFLDVFDHLAVRVEPHLRFLTELFLAITSETLITGTLNKLPNDPTVQPAVRAIAKDHATDEGRHHAYFRALCLALWPRLPYEVQIRVGVLIPEMILAFLSPSVIVFTRLLQRFPTFADSAREIAEEAASHPSVIDSIYRSAAPTLRVFKEAGVFEHALVIDAFRSREFNVSRTE